MARKLGEKRMIYEFLTIECLTFTFYNSIIFIFLIHAIELKIYFL